MHWIVLGWLFQVSASQSLVDGTATPEELFCRCQRVMVVAPDPASQDAAAAFKAALRAEVVPQAPMGDVQGLGDDQIAERAAKFNVDAVVVIRATPIPWGTETTMTRYGSADKSWSTLTRRDVKDPAPALQAAQDALHGASDRGSAAQAEESLSLRRGEFHRKRLDPTPAAYQYTLGVDRTPLAESEFYQTVGREDLAQTLSNRTGTQAAWMVGGGVAAALGVGLSFVGFVGGGAEGEMPHLAIGLGGVASAALGLAGLIYGGTYDVHPVSPSEADDLAQDHNARLAGSLGITQP